MSSGVMNFKDSFLTSSKFYEQSGPVNSNRRFIKGHIIVYTVRIFSSSELVEPHIIPLKVRLAVALKAEAK